MGEAGRRSINALFQSHVYGTEHTLKVVHHLPIPKTEHAVASGFQDRGALRVVFLLVQVLASVQLDNQLPARRTKIDHVLSDGVLVAEMDLPQPMRAQPGPEPGLRWGQVSVEFFGVTEDLRGGAFVHGILTLLPHFTAR